MAQYALDLMDVAQPRAYTSSPLPGLRNHLAEYRFFDPAQLAKPHEFILVKADKSLPEHGIRKGELLLVRTESDPVAGNGVFVRNVDGEPCLSVGGELTGGQVAGKVVKVFSGATRVKFIRNLRILRKTADYAAW